ncbi:MAG: hypothetical protein ACRD2W_10260 [Acidimicrobiales bacterium]
MDLGAGTLAGYPGIAGLTGKVGIVGIPLVVFDAAGQNLTILGSPAGDDLTYTPAMANGGALTNRGLAQTLRFSGVPSLLVDRLGGDDVVGVVGTANADSVAAVVDTTTTVRVGTTLMVRMPILNVERLAITTAAVRTPSRSMRRTRSTRT